MARVWSLILPVVAVTLGFACSSPSTPADAATGADSGNAGVDSGTTPPDASSPGPDASSGTDSGSAGSDSGSGSDAGACVSQLGSCNPCQGWLGNDAGLGAYCSAGGNQCMNGTYCPADFGQNQNYCVSVGSCDSDAGTGCGPGECCVVENNPFGGTVVVCLPSGCLGAGC